MGLDGPITPRQDGAVCLFCKSTGVCAKCEGRGVRPGTIGRRRTMVVCNACEGSKICPLCHGHGVVGSTGRSSA